jgi:hypothetical protein
MTYKDDPITTSCALLALSDGVHRLEVRRACRHHVKWPARVRAVAETDWHQAHVVNLSVTGVLLQIPQAYKIGQRVEVEIEFDTQSGCRTVVAGIGWVVREEDTDPRNAAIHFDLGYEPRFVES